MLEQDKALLKKNMTSILNKNKLILFFLLQFILSFLFVGDIVLADENSQTLSVSPTLIQVTAVSGQEWKSSLRIFNVNDYDMEVSSPDGKKFTTCE